jgi:hypothetical protein
VQADDDRRAIKHLRKELRRRENAAIDEKDTASAVEQSLLAQVEELSM